MKKGSITDSVYIIYLVFGVFLIAIISMYILSTLSTTAPFSTHPATSAFLANGIKAFTYLDLFIPMAWVVFTLSAIALAMTVAVPGVFMFIGAFMFMVMPFLSAFIANIFYQIIALPAFAGVAGTFVYTTVFFDNLPALSVVSGVLIFIATYAKGKGGIQPAGWG